MPDPLDDAPELDRVVELVADAARAYLPTVGERPVRSPDEDAALRRLAGPLPADGDGALKALTELIEVAPGAATVSSGPRFFGFVVGGATPAGLGGDWLTSTLDQNVGMWLGSGIGSGLEAIAIEWLKELFALPRGWGGVLVTGATMANFTALAAARRWCGLQHGIDVDEAGLRDAPTIPVFSSGYVHASSLKVLGMMGIGRAGARLLARDARGRLDLDRLGAELRALDGAPSIVIANAGEVNAGDFDPLPDIVELAHRHNTWVHVDGAFGLFSRVTPKARALTDGIEGAHSVISDGHKWLNVPHDCGFVFLRDASLLPGVFASSASYLVGGGDDRPNFAMLGPESSQRARAFTVWATLRAYGADGYRAMIERHLGLAQRVARRIDDAPDLERLADVPLNIVCFRYRPPDADAGELDPLNRRLADAIVADGRVYVGTTVFEGAVAFRPAIVNWRTTESDVDLLVDVVRELGAALPR